MLTNMLVRMKNKGNNRYKVSQTRRPKGIAAKLFNENRVFLKKVYGKMCFFLKYRKIEISSWQKYLIMSSTQFSSSCFIIFTFFVNIVEASSLEHPVHNRKF